MKSSGPSAEGTPLPNPTPQELERFFQSFAFEPASAFECFGRGNVAVAARLDALRKQVPPSLAAIVPVPEAMPSRAPPLPVPLTPPPHSAPMEPPPLKLPPDHPPVLVFDTETTALSPPIVCQLAFVIIENGTPTKSYDQILKLPHGVFVGRIAQSIHGISTQDCRTKGVDARAALADFATDCQRVLLAGGRIVAHNISFDIRAINATREAHGVADAGENQALELKDGFCTKNRSNAHSPLKNRKGHRKPFTCAEMYEFFYDSPPTWARLHRCALRAHSLPTHTLTIRVCAHSAGDDVMVCALCYAAGVSARWW